MFVIKIYIFFVPGMGGHGYSSQSESTSGFHSGHFVHMRGLPFRATEGDIAKVSQPQWASVCLYNQSVTVFFLFFFLVIINVLFVTYTQVSSINDFVRDDN